MRKVLLAASMMLSTSVCVAETSCERLARTVLQSNQDQSSSWIGAVCRATPDDAKKSILIMDHQLYLVDSRSGLILSQGDANTSSNIDSIDSIDTGRYWLAPKVRAFGVRSSEYRPHYQAGETLYALNLYVIEGKTIRPVLEELAIGYHISSAECNEKEECTEHQSNQDLTVDIAKTSHNGFADLIVAGKVLTYDGSRYVVPAELRQQ